MIIFVRHGHTTYSEIYPDLTDEGIQSVNETAGKIKKIIENKNPKSVKVVCSPAPRAQGTADIIIKELNISTKRIDDPFLSAIQFNNQEQALSFHIKSAKNGNIL
ncbi:hypothetical protein GF340_04015 [Candidatus Peregrinibacteria bacterium]|nr:hypothetical protein [Candidatus Peregrinibacteria bacterium]